MKKIEGLHPHQPFFNKNYTNLKKKAPQRIPIGKNEDATVFDEIFMTGRF